MTYIIYPNLGEYLFSSLAAAVQKMNIKDCTLTKIALLKLIRRLPNAAPVTDRWWPTDHHPNKEHWIGWLEEYDGPGYYNRRHPSAHRDAAFIITTSTARRCFHGLPNTPKYLQGSSGSVYGRGDLSLTSRAGRRHSAKSCHG